MTGQTPKKKKSCSGWMLGCGLGLFALVALLLIAGLIGYVLTRRTLDKTPLVTSILSPQNEEQVETNQPLLVQSEATYSSGVSRVEVYADGALILAQDAAEEGSTSLSVDGAWIPLTPGSHVLSARGYGSDETFSDSEIITVLVNEPPDNVVINVDTIKKEPGSPNPSLADIASVYGMTPEELASRNPALSGTSHTEPLPPGSRIDAPRPPSPPSPSSPPSSPPSPPLGAPAAPTNIGTGAACTSATLTWTDSPDETSYRVYRLDTGAARPRVVADSLPANTITFTDTLPALGVYRYQVAAVRAGREGLSLMASAETAGSCPEPAAPFGGTSDLVLTIAMVDTTSAYEGIYCYLSINGQPYERIPVGTAVIPPDTGNNLYYNLSRLPGGGRYNLGAQPPTSPVTLQGECDGFQAPFSHGLGTFSISHPQSDWDGRMLRADGGLFHFSYCIGPASVPCTPTIPGGTSGYTSTDFDLPPIGIIEINLPPPTILAVTGSTPADCASITSYLERLTCGLGRILSASTSGAWKTVTWDWQGSPYLPESSLTSYTVVRTVVDPATGNQNSFWWDVTPRPDGTLPKMSLSDNRGVSCSSRVEYRVRANQAGRQSRLSDPVSFETPRCPTAVDLVITFVSLEVGPAADVGEEYFLFVPAGDDTLEIYRNIYAAGGSLPWTSRELATSPPTYSIREGSYAFSRMPFTGGNIFRARIDNEQQTLTLGSGLMEADTNWSGSQVIRTVPFCDAHITLPVRSLETWGNLNQTFTIDCNSTEADASITVLVIGNPVR